MANCPLQSLRGSLQRIIEQYGEIDRSFSYEAATNLLQMAMVLMESRPGLLTRLSLVWPHLSTCMVFVVLSFLLELLLNGAAGGNVWFWDPHALLV